MAEGVGGIDMGVQFQVREQHTGFRRERGENSIAVQQFQGPGQAIALARYREDIDTQIAQGLEVFPDRRAADAQGAAQLRSGMKAAVAQGLEDFET